MHAGRKHRDRDHRRVPLRGERYVFPERQFGDVPFERPGELKGDFLDRGKDERRQADAVRAHQPLGDLAHVLVVTDGEAEMHRRGAVTADDLRPRVSEAAGFAGADGIGAEVAGADFCCADVGCADVACTVIEFPRAVRPLLLGARAVRNDSGGQVPRASNSRKPGPPA